MVLINSPEVVAELSRLHDAYERALAANDVAALNTFFWDSPHTVRFGVNEHLYGVEAVAAYRRSHTPVFTDRVLQRRTIVSFGTDFASIMSEFTQKIAGQLRHSRQSQVWAQVADSGWKIIGAHVSNALTAPVSAANWDAYVDQAAAALGLPLDPAHRPGVIQNLQRASAIVAPLTNFTLPPATEIAPVFMP
jgi:hypothetical protein